MRKSPGRMVAAEFYDWRSESLLRDFLEKRPRYQQLVEEVSFLMRHRLDNGRIDFAHVTGRVKSIPSILNKIERKQYAIDDITDLAGVRVVCLYRPDIERISAVIKDTFDVEEQVEKSHDEDQFGYLARHFIVRVRPAPCGDRYVMLKGLSCEVQVRTVLQDAWAVLDHHLRYKQQTQVPRQLRRDLFSLAAVLENADGQFTQIAAERARYERRLNQPRTKIESLLSEETNRDAIVAYLKKRFRGKQVEAWHGHLDFALEHLDTTRFRTLKDVHDALERTEKARATYQRSEWAEFGAAQLALALACVDPAYRKATRFGRDARAVVAAFNGRKKSRQRVDDLPSAPPPPGAST